MQVASQKPKRSKNNFRLRLLTGLIFMALAVAFAIQRGLPTKIAQHFLVNSILAVGGHDFRMDHISLSQNHFRIRNLSFKIGTLNHEVTIPEIKATYALQKIFNGKIQSLFIRSPKVIVRHDPTAPPPSIAEITNDVSNALKKLEGVDHIDIDDIHLEIDDPVSPLILTGQLEQEDDLSEKSYLLTLESDDFDVEATFINKFNALTVHIELIEIDLNQKWGKLTTPEFNIDLEKSFTDDIIKIKSQGTITVLEVQNYGHLTSPIVCQTDLQKTGSLLTGVANIYINNESSGQSIILTPDLDIESIAGTVQLDANFSPEQLWSWEKILTRFIPQFTKLGGQFKTQGMVKFTGGWQEIDTNLKVIIRNGTVGINELLITGLNTDLTLNKLFPLVTAQTQSLKANHVTYDKLNLSNLHAVISTSPDGSLKLHSFKAHVFSGEVSLHSFRQRGKNITDGIRFKADCNNIELSELIKYSEIVDLQAEAKLVGEGDFDYSSKGLEVLNASLRSTSPEGKLKYITKKGSEHNGNKAAEVALKALEDLHFTLLEIAINPDETTPEVDIQAKIKLLGFNPKVLNGYPFEFNIQTRGQLGDLMRNAINNLAPIKNLDDVNKMVVDR